MRIRALFLFSLSLTLAASLYSQTGKTYMDKKHGFSVNYPGDFEVLVGKRAVSETAFGEPGKGEKLVKISPRSIPEKFHGWYEFNVWRSTDATVKCGAIEAGEENAIPFEEPSEGAPKTRMIDGHTFYAYVAADGGMSKQMGVGGYRGMVNNSCWQIQSMSYQVSAFDDFKTFNGKIIDKAFDQFVNSFKFIK